MNSLGDNAFGVSHVIDLVSILLDAGASHKLLTPGLLTADYVFATT
jgi:hypothetical protein